MTVRVRLLGRPWIESSPADIPSDGPDSGPDFGSPRLPLPALRGRKSWALLARVALAERPLSRHELAAELWAEADDPMAALRWCLADLRRGLNDAAILRGDRLELIGEQFWLDVRALDAGDLPAQELGGVLLEGIELADSPGFDTWLLLARARCTARSREELRAHALRLLTAGATGEAVDVAQRAAQLDPLDESAQELLLRTLMADGRPGVAAAHLAACEGTFAREGLVVSAATLAAAQPRVPAGVRSGIVAASLLRAGTAALDAGAADGGVETLRRAAEDAARAGDPDLQARVLKALGSALVHAVRGFDGEGAVVLHQALAAARTAGNPAVAADALRELAFIDIQAGRHASAARALREAKAEAEADPGLDAAILAAEGMNSADLGRHHTAIELLNRSAAQAGESGRPRQQAWSLGVLSRSLLLAGQTESARLAAETSLELAHAERWNAFLPWPQAIRAECLLLDGHPDEARAEAEEAFALGCELADPCWEGMSARSLSLVERQAGNLPAAWDWIIEARQRCDRVSDRYVWVSGYVGLTQLELATELHPELVAPLAARLHDDAVRADLPEFLAWALVHQETAAHPLARAAAREVDNPRLHARLDAHGAE